jgi:hypothetical protein
MRFDEVVEVVEKIQCQTEGREMVVLKESGIGRMELVMGLSSHNA